ncbi:hypothetical protein D0Z00_000302 [Geotrichum galactomycetum]|uniref:Uncharacterized protein n=1 Tax=Geotrichum galactomycetum TaxID=27317 RepID=A0ACB6VAC1_9ASCO|nr:hypothetical protein D0Z00_000302 [Geotrichum candidum]
MTAPGTSTINTIYPHAVVALSDPGFPVPSFQLLVPDRDLIVRYHLPASYPAGAPVVDATETGTHDTAFSKESASAVLDSVWAFNDPTTESWLPDFIAALRSLYDDNLVEIDEDLNDWSRPEYIVDPTDLDSEVTKVWATSRPLRDRRSTFIALARTGVDSVPEAEAALRALKADSHVAQADHVAVAYRIRDSEGGLIEYFDDDGETAAGARLLHSLILQVLLVLVFCHSPFGQQ